MARFLEKSKGPRAPREIVSVLEKALASARMESCAVGQEHQEAMRLYLDSWVASRLEGLLAWAKGEPVEVDSDYIERRNWASRGEAKE